MPQNEHEDVKATKVLELNAQHPIFEKLKKLYAEDKDKLTDYTKLLYDQALLMAGLELEDPAKYALQVSELMLKALK